MYGLNCVNNIEEHCKSPFEDPMNTEHFSRSSVSYIEKESELLIKCSFCIADKSI